MNQAQKHSLNDTGPDGSAGGARKTPRFAFIQAGWHREILDRGRDAFLSEMRRRGVNRESIDLYDVPGAFEIPLHAKMLARTGCYAAIVACGFVVDGGIYRHEFVAGAVVDALMRVQLEAEIPVISAVLTPKHFHDHADHRKFFTEHFIIKGTEAATACLDAVAGLATVHELMAAA